MPSFIESVQFPRLKHPLRTKGMSDTSRMIFLAYDIIWRLVYTNETNLTDEQQGDLIHDTYANLQQLGQYIEHTMEHRAAFDADDELNFNYIQELKRAQNNNENPKGG